MSKKARRRKQIEDAEQSGLTRMLRDRYKYVISVLFIVQGVGIGTLISLPAAIGLAILCGLLGFVTGFLIDITAKNRSINRGPMKFQEYWYGEVKHGGNSSSI